MQKFTDLMSVSKEIEKYKKRNIFRPNVQFIDVGTEYLRYAILKIK